MFKSRTLLVLGAGASNEVNMPLGVKLLSDIGERLDLRFGSNGMQQSGSLNILDALRSHVYRTSNGKSQDIRPYIEAAWAIRDVAPMAKSIDDVIDRRDDARISLCGKLAIAECILSAERASALFIPPPHEQPDQVLNHKALKSTWFYSFINMLIEGVPRGHLSDLFNNVSVISFNYDRCFKHFLTQALKLQYGLRLDEAQEIVCRLKTIYPYGTISPLEFEDGLGLSFGARINGEKLLDISSQIRTFTEQTSDDELTSDIKREIYAARRIIFLGFAFHPQNLRILSANDLERMQIIGTAFGISRQNTDAIRAELKSTLNIMGMTGHELTLPSAEHVILESISCACLLQDYSRILVS
ncbi:MAG: hypothetical protein ACLP7P_03815 [Rhodomicrobium sp.]